MRKWVMWSPVVMIGALVYWTLAFSFGGLSLLSIGGFQDPDVLDAAGLSLRDSYQSITVNLSGAPDPQGQGQLDVVPESDMTPASVTVDLVSDHESGRESPRQTAHPSGQDDDRGQGDRGGNVRGDHGPGVTAF